MRNKYLSLWVAVALVGFMSFSGCGGAQQDDGITRVKVAFWGSPDEIEIINTSMSDWQADTSPWIPPNRERRPKGD